MAEKWPQCHINAIHMGCQGQRDQLTNCTWLSNWKKEPHQQEFIYINRMYHHLDP